MNLCSFLNYIKGDRIGRAVMKKAKNDIVMIIAYVFVVFCAFVMVLNASDNPFHIGNTYPDSSVFNYVARLILRGGMPYRDTFDHKGPLIYLIDALGLIVNRQVGICIIECCFSLVTFLFAYKTARVLGCGHISSCVAVAVNMLTLSYFFAGGNLVEEYACTFLAISLYLFCKYFRTKEIKTIELVICGATFAAVCLLRINMIALWIVMCVGVLVDRVKAKKALDLLRFIICFIGGAALITVPIIIWLLLNSALDPFIQDYFFFNFMYSSDAGSASTFNVIYAILYFSTSIPMVLCFPILLYYCIESKNLFDWLCLLSVLLSLLLMCISGKHYTHYGMILCPFVTYSVSRLFSNLDVSYRHTKKYTAVFFSAIVAIALLFSHVEMDIANNIVSTILHPEISFYENEVATIVKKNTKEGDKISVCGNNNIVYLLSGRDSVSKYSYQYPIALIDPAIKEEYLEDLKKFHAQMIIIEDNNFLYSEVCDIVHGNYDLISTVDNTEVYLRRQPDTRNTTAY